MTRRELAVASGAAVVATVGDLLLLFVSNSSRPELGLPRPPELALPLGALLGVCAIPVYALGYRAVARAIRPGSRTLARVVLVCGSAAAAVGALIHGLTALTIRAAIESGASAGPPMEAVAASSAGLVAAWITASFLFLFASIAVFAARALPRSVAWLNPLAVTVVLVVAGLPSELGRSFLVPAAPNLAHVAFFFVALSALGSSSKARITSKESLADGYESFYREFDSPLMRQIRREAYGEDIGQHSWVGADELRGDIRRLELSPSSRFLDLGCGPCGPLTFMLAAVGCRGTGVELSPSALQVGRARAVSLGIEALLSVREADLNESLPFAPGSFDAAMSLDVVLHLHDRSKLFRDVAKLLPPGGRFLFTDAGVLTGSVSSEEVRKRSVHGYTQFVAPGWNEELLESAGFRLIETEDRTLSVLKNAGGRLAAMQAHRAELEQVSGAAAFESQRDYLETVVELSRRRAVSRVMYLAEAHARAI